MSAFSSANMLLRFLLTFTQISTAFTDDLLAKFHQNDYNVKDLRGDLIGYDKNVLRFAEFKTFKYNRTTVAFNITVNCKIDLKNEIEVLVQQYKFASNEYREFPVHYQVNLARAYDFNVIGFQLFSKCGNIQNIYFLKDITYHTCNFVPDISHLPPLMPSGIYKVELQFMYLEKEIAIANVYGEVYRPIYPPKEGSNENFWNKRHF